MVCRYAGIDWAWEEHDVVVADEAGVEVLGATCAQDERGLVGLCRTLVRLDGRHIVFGDEAIAGRMRRSSASPGISDRHLRVALWRGAGVEVCLAAQPLSNRQESESVHDPSGR